MGVCSLLLHLTTIPVELKILKEFKVIKFKTCSLYHENRGKSSFTKIHRAPSEPAKLPGQFSHSGQMYLHTAATQKGLEILVNL